MGMKKIWLISRKYSSILVTLAIHATTRESMKSWAKLRMNSPALLKNPRVGGIPAVLKRRRARLSIPPRFELPKPWRDVSSAKSPVPSPRAQVASRARVPAVLIAYCAPNHRAAVVLRSTPIRRKPVFATEL